jgi:hypothetical protein
MSLLDTSEWKRVVSALCTQAEQEMKDVTNTLRQVPYDEYITALENYKDYQESARLVGRLNGNEAYVILYFNCARREAIGA